jgi:transposase
MDEREQRFVIKFLWLQEQKNKAILTHLRDTLRGLAVALPTVKLWLRRFREGDTSCEDRSRAGRPLTILGEVLSKTFSKHPFASPENIASHFDLRVSTVMGLLARELGLRIFTRRWVPYSLWERQKDEQATQSRLLLDLVQCYQTANFNAIATGDESWFRYVDPARTMNARSRSDVTSCVGNGIDTSKVLITIFSWNAILSSEGSTKGPDI